MNKTMTVRIPENQAAEFETVARIDQVSVAEAARQAIEEHVKMRRADADFQARLKHIMKRDREILDGLAKGAGED